MTKVIIVQKGGILLSKNVNQLEPDILYKSCGLRSAKDFDHRYTWKNNNESYVSLYARDDGKANMENKYDLPPPLDSVLFFNKMLLIKHSSDEYDDSEAMDLTTGEWKSLYERLFGGFEDLKDETESSEEDIPLELRTKQGYSKADGFVVDDDEEEDLEYLSNGDDEILDSNDESEEYLDDNESMVDSEEGDKPDDSEDDSIIDDSDDSGDESELTEESYLSDNSYD
jgi:hypothetical protein